MRHPLLWFALPVLGAWACDIAGRLIGGPWLGVVGVGLFAIAYIRLVHWLIREP